MLKSTEMVRTHRSTMQTISDIDNEPMPSIEIGDELRQMALDEYCEWCRSNPEELWPDFSEFLMDYIQARTYEDSLAAWEEEIADEMEAQREVELARQRELPFPPYSDDDYPF